MEKRSVIILVLIVILVILVACNNFVLAESNSSIISNNGKYVVGDVKYYLQKNEGGSWVDKKTYEYPGIPINSLGYIDLKNGFNELGDRILVGWDNENIMPDNEGSYRIRALFQSGSNIAESYYEFNVEGNCVPNCNGRECGPNGCGGECLPGCDVSRPYCYQNKYCQKCRENEHCNDNNKCTEDICLGDGSCKNEEITNCLNGDGCCPSGCTTGNDDDCDVPGEWTLISPTPDYKTSCEAECNSIGKDCLDYSCEEFRVTYSRLAFLGGEKYTSGSNLYHNFCDHESSFVNPSSIGLYCCCGNCNRNCNGRECGDDGCGGVCGECSGDQLCGIDGLCVDCVVDRNCDDNNKCTRDLCSGSSCQNIPISQCQYDDGCCPSGCTINNDNDCSIFSILLYTKKTYDLGEIIKI